MENRILLDKVNVAKSSNLKKETSVPFSLMKLRINKGNSGVPLIPVVIDDVAAATKGQAWNDAQLRTDNNAQQFM